MFGIIVGSGAGKYFVASNYQTKYHYYTTYYTKLQQFSSTAKMSLQHVAALARSLVESRDPLDRTCLTYISISIINDRLKAQPVKPVHIQYELQCKKLITIIKQKSI